MPRPGVNIAFGDATTSSDAPDTAQWFIAGETTKGAPGVAHRVSSLTSLNSKLGAPLSGSKVYNAVETALREQTKAVFVSRVVGPGAVSASLALEGAGALPAITVLAKSPGEYGNDLRVAVLAGSTSGYRLQVSDTVRTLETSRDLADNDAAVAWGLTASHVVVEKDGEDLPSVAVAAPLTGGDDDSESITDAEKIASLGAFSRSLGPGQLTLPGEDDPEVLSAALAHGNANDRVVLIDGPDSTDIADFISVRESLKNDPNASFGAVFGPTVSVPGPAGTLRRVPYSAVQAGICARCDRIANPGHAAAGEDFPHLYAVDFHDFTDAEIEEALLSGVNLAKNNYGVPQTYGFRSLVDPEVEPDWVQFNYARLRMAISARLNRAAQRFVFSQLDGAGHTRTRFSDALTAVLTDFYVENALFGEMASDAFVVDVSEDVNTLESIKAGELHAVVGVKFTPHAEVVYIDVSKVPLTQNIT